MKKYLSWLGLLPVAILTMIFLNENELNTHIKKECIGLFLSLIIFILFYFMLYLQVKRGVCIIIAIFLSIIAFFIKKIY